MLLKVGANCTGSGDAQPLKLHELKRERGMNRYCGPAALSFVLNITTDQSAALIRGITGKRAVTGTSRDAIKRAFERHGIRMTGVAAYRKADSPTLAGWLKDTPRDSDQLYLIVAGHHWQLIMGRRYACGRIGAIVSLRDERVKRRAKISDVFELSRM